jgi:hypothetical protein
MQQRIFAFVFLPVLNFFLLLILEDSDEGIPVSPAVLTMLCFLVYYLEHDVSETRFCFRLQVESAVKRTDSLSPKNNVFRDVTQCGFCKNRRFRGT